MNSKNLFRVYSGTTELQKKDLKSMLSIVADSAEVEVWLITPALMEIMPTAVQQVVLERLQEKQLVKIHNVDEIK